MVKPIGSKFWSKYFQVSMISTYYLMKIYAEGSLKLFWKKVVRWGNRQFGKNVLREVKEKTSAIKMYLLNNWKNEMKHL